MSGRSLGLIHLSKEVVTQRGFDEEISVIQAADKEMYT